MAWSDVGLFVLTLGIAVIPVLQRNGFESLKEKFLWVHSEFYLFAAAFFAARLAGLFVEPVWLALITIGAAMLLSSFLAFYFDKSHFFYVLVSVPASLLLPAYYIGQFIGAVGAVMAFVVLSEIFVYLALNGTLFVRTISVFGIMSTFTGIIYFFPIPLFPDSVSTIFLEVSYLCMAVIVWLVAANTDRELELRSSPSINYIWYVTATLLFLMITGSVIEWFSPAYALSGSVTVLALTAVRYTDFSRYQEMVGFVTTSFLVCATLWLVISLINITRLSPTVIIEFDLTLTEFIIIGLTHLFSISVLRNAQRQA